MKVTVHWDSEILFFNSNILFYLPYTVSWSLWYSSILATILLHGEVLPWMTEDICILCFIQDGLLRSWEPIGKLASNTYVWPELKHSCGCTCSQLIQHSSCLPSLCLSNSQAGQLYLNCEFETDSSSCWSLAVPATCLGEYWTAWPKDLSWTSLTVFQYG